MMNRRTLERTIRRLLGDYWYNRLWASRRYMRIIRAAEQYREAQRSSVDDPELLLARLRKVAHILDKALQLKQYQVGRSRQYVEEASRLCAILAGSSFAQDPSFLWAQKKVREYAERQERPSAAGHDGFRPTQITYEQARELIYSRRSIRKYEERRIDPSLVDRIAEAAVWAPCSCNRQTLQVFGTTRPSEVREAMTCCAGATCFGDCVPLFLSVCVDWRAYVLPEEVMLPYIDAGLAAQNSCLVAHSLGISLTLLTWEQRKAQDESKLRGLLGIPDRYEIVINAVGGYPRSGVEAPARKDLNTFRNIRY